MTRSSRWPSSLSWWRKASSRPADSAPAMSWTWSWGDCRGAGAGDEGEGDPHQRHEDHEEQGDDHAPSMRRGCDERCGTAGGYVGRANRQGRTWARERCTDVGVVVDGDGLVVAGPGSEVSTSRTISSSLGRSNTSWSREPTAVMSATDPAKRARAGAVRPPGAPCRAAEPPSIRRRVASS